MARLLEKIGTKTPFDFSSALVVAGWINNSLSNHSHHLAEVARAIHRFHERIGLKRGHGLTQLWSALVTAVENQDVSERLLVYESAVLNQGGASTHVKY